MDAAAYIKANLPIRTVVEHYGYHPNRGNYISCPFHDEKTASLKIYPGNNSWYCYGCGQGGTQIDFVMKLFHVPFRAALVRIDSDFGLNVIGGHVDRAALEREKAEQARRRAEAAEAERKANERALILARLHRHLYNAMRIGPDSIDYDMACWVLPYLEYMFDEEYYAACGAGGVGNDEEKSGQAGRHDG